MPPAGFASSQAWSGDEFECTDEEGSWGPSALGPHTHRTRQDCWGRSQYDFYFEQTIEVWRVKENGEWKVHLERETLYILYNEGHSTFDRMWRFQDRGTFGQAHVSYMEARPADGDGCNSRVHYFTKDRDPSQELKHSLPGCITEPRTFMPTREWLP